MKLYLIYEYKGIKIQEIYSGNNPIPDLNIDLNIEFSPNVLKDMDTVSILHHPGFPFMLLCKKIPKDYKNLFKLARMEDEL